MKSGTKRMEKRPGARPMSIEKLREIFIENLKIGHGSRDQMRGLDSNHLTPCWP